MNRTMDSMRDMEKIAAAGKQEIVDDLDDIFMDAEDERNGKSTCEVQAVVL